MDTKKKLQISSETLRNLSTKTGLKTGIKGSPTGDCQPIPPPRHSANPLQPCAGPALPQ